MFIAGMVNFGVFASILWVTLLMSECFVYLVASLSPHYIIGIAVCLVLGGD